MENFRTLANDLHHQKMQAPNKPNMEKKPIKVKYISSPMMVKANNESEFRAIVQKLTGQHSPDDANFDQSPHEFSPASFDAKDRCGLFSSSVCDPVRVGVGVGEVYDSQGEMEGTFLGFHPSYTHAWP